MVEWEQSRISGLTVEPIVLQGYYSQTYGPWHHNFSEEFIFEPRLEPGLPAEQLNAARVGPEALVGQSLEPGDRILDPSCGEGSFLVRAVDAQTLDR